MPVVVCVEVTVDASEFTIENESAGVVPTSRAGAKITCTVAEKNSSRSQAPSMTTWTTLLRDNPPPSTKNCPVCVKARPGGAPGLARSSVPSPPAVSDSDLLLCSTTTRTTMVSVGSKLTLGVIVTPNLNCVAPPSTACSGIEPPVNRSPASVSSSVLYITLRGVAAAVETA